MKKSLGGAVLCLLLPAVCIVPAAAAAGARPVAPASAAAVAPASQLDPARAPWAAAVALPRPASRPQTPAGTAARSEVQVLTGDGYAGIFPIQNIGSRFGSAMTRAGSTLFVGAIGDGDYSDPADPYNLVPPTLAGKGSVYVFEQSGGTWHKTQKLVGAGGGDADFFGNAIAVSGDTLMVGATYATINGVYGQGAVYVFKRNQGVWQQTQKLTADDGMLLSEFGWSVAIENGVAVIGAPIGLREDGSLEPGAAYVFVETDGVWQQTQKLVASNGVQGDQFGNSVALSGGMVLVGAPITQVGVGSVYVFGQSNGSWTQTQRVTGCYQPGQKTNFGTSMAADGNRVLVGAPGGGTDANPLPGAACLMTESNGHWSITHTLSAVGGSTNETFGVAVALKDGVAAVSAPLVNWSTTDPRISQGAVYVFEASGSGWTQVDEIARNQPPLAGDGYYADSLGDGGVAIDGSAILAATSIAGVYGVGTVAVYDRPAVASAAPSALTLSVGAGASAWRTVTMGNSGAHPLSYEVVDGTVLSQISSDVPSDDPVDLCYLVPNDDPEQLVGTADNAWYRRFYFDEHPQVGTSATIDGVTVGIQRSPVGMPVSIKLYSMPSTVPVDTIDGEQLTLIGQTTIAADGNPTPALRIPVSGTISDTATEDLVVEYSVPWTEATPPFLPAINSHPQSHNAFKQATCFFGFSHAGRWNHVVITPHLDAAVSGLQCASAASTPWLTVAQGQGNVVSGSTQPIAIGIDASALAPGHYTAQVCVEAKSPLRSMITIPVDLTVTEPLPDAIFRYDFEAPAR